METLFVGFFGMVGLMFGLTLWDSFPIKERLGEWKREWRTLLPKSSTSSTSSDDPTDCDVLRVRIFNDLDYYNEDLPNRVGNSERLDL